MILQINENSDEPYKQEENSDCMYSDGDISESSRVRCSCEYGNELDRILLDYNGYILCTIIPILYIIFQIV